MLVDDHAIVREELREVPESVGRFDVIGQAVDVVEVVKPDVVVVELTMPNNDGVEASRDILEEVPQTDTLVLTASTVDDSIVSALVRR